MVFCINNVYSSLLSKVFDARSFVSRMLGMGDVQGLYHKIKDNIGLDNQPEMIEKFRKGVFTLRDMYVKQ